MNRWLEKVSIRAVELIGSPASLVIHTAVFAGIFLLMLLGFTFTEVLLILTTAVSLEAIYLAIFVQMTLNQHTRSLKEVESDVRELTESDEDDTMKT